MYKERRKGRRGREKNELFIHPREKETRTKNIRKGEGKKEKERRRRKEIKNPNKILQRNTHKKNKIQDKKTGC